MVSWKEQQKMLEDSRQYQLNPDLTITKNKSFLIENKPKIEFDMVVLCPFCLMSYELDKFSLRKGLRVCPNCGSKLKLSTLAEISDLDRFVEFVFHYRFSGFWSKICLDVLENENRDARFREWNKRLRNLGLSLQFWEKYKNLKGDSDTE